MTARPHHAAVAAVLDGLDAEQQQAVLAPLGPVRILAGAGTGKTRTMTHRIAYQILTGQVRPQEVLAVTHSARAASELRDRLDALGVHGVQVRTFHAAALRQLSYFWSATGMPGNGPQLITTVRGGRYGFIRNALATTLAIPSRAVESTDVLDLDGEITWARARRLSPTAYIEAATKAGRARTLAATTLAAAYQQYELDKRAAELVDFDDLLSSTAALIEQHPQVAQRVRASYTSFVVDEYQDTDPSQQRLLDAWLGDRDTVAVVGDAQQAIYAFRGGDQTLIDTFTARYPHAVSISLVRDYRSTPQIVDLANRVLANAPGPRVVLEGQRSPGPLPVLRSAQNESAEAVSIATRVRDLIACGTDASEIAVLHRFNSQAVRLEAALRDAGVPTSTGGGERFFDRPEILTALRALAGRAQRDPELHGTTALAESLASTGFDKRNPPAGAGAARERWEAQAALYELAKSLPAAAQDSAQSLLDELSRRARDEHTPQLGGAVTISTIHKAKGLEWDAVFVAHLTEGSLPSAFAKSSAEIAEERRLFYVAATRARHHLELWHAEERDGSGWKLKRSRFLSEALPDRERTPRAGAGAQRTAGRSYSRGDRVTHDSFGLGWVTAVNGLKVEVDFGSTGRREVRSDSAKLEKL